MKMHLKMILDLWLTVAEIYLPTNKDRGTIHENYGNAG